MKSLRMAQAHSMPFNVLAILISFLCVSLHHGLMERNLTGVLMIDHFLFFLLAPDREERALLCSPSHKPRGTVDEKHQAV